MRNPEEIKKGLKVCAYEPSCIDCPYSGDDCIHLEIDALECIQQLEAGQLKWISVDERLPGEPGEVLVCIYGKVGIAWYADRCFETPSGMILLIDNDAVTHWMAMPDPPKEEAE